MVVRVECYSGYKSDERPTRFWLGGTLLEVESVEDRWYSPGCTFFRVVAGGGDRYLLRRDEGQDTWELQGFRASDGASTPLTQK